MTSFEESLEQLEKLVETLSQEDTSLKDALEAYETSQTLIAEAEKALAEAEQKVLQLTGPATALDLEPFDTSDLEA